MIGLAAIKVLYPTVATEDPVGIYSLPWQYNNEILTYILALPKNWMIKKNSSADVENEICLENDKFAFWKTYGLSKLF